MLYTINRTSVLVLGLILWNIISFIIMGVDKRKAIKGKWRIQERTLFLISFIFGGIGIFLGMWIFRHKTKHNSFRILVPISLLINIVLDILLYYMLSGIGVTTYSVVSDRIPSEFNGFKIVQLSDFHNGTFRGSKDTLIDKVKAQKPNIIAITGDIIQEDVPNLHVVSRLIDGLKGTCPIYFVSGNHDVWYKDYKELVKLLESKGVVIADNKKFIIKRGNAHINLYGIGDPNVWDGRDANRFVDNEISKLNPRDGYNILLFHRASMFETIKGKGFQLAITGHMHGGQVQIPFIGGLIAPNSKLLPKYTQGRYAEEGTTMIVSRGLGNMVWQPRVLNPPEVVAVTLKSE